MLILKTQYVAPSRVHPEHIRVTNLKTGHAMRVWFDCRADMSSNNTRAVMTYVNTKHPEFICWQTVEQVSIAGWDINVILHDNEMLPMQLLGAV